MLAKRAGPHDRQDCVRIELESTELDNDQIADPAIAAFELSQILTKRWLTPNYQAKTHDSKHHARNRAFEIRKSRLYPEKTIQFAA